MEERRESLQETRRDRIVALQTLVFPIYVEPLSQDDAGEDGTSRQVTTFKREN